MAKLHRILPIYVGMEMILRHSWCASLQWKCWTLSCTHTSHQSPTGRLSCSIFRGPQISQPSTCALPIGSNTSWKKNQALVSWGATLDGRRRSPRGAFLVVQGYGRAVRRLCDKNAAPETVHASWGSRENCRSGLHRRECARKLCNVFTCAQKGEK